MTLDIQGFQLSPESGGEYLLRELGWCARNRTTSASAQINHGRQWSRLAEVDQTKITQLIREESGLPFRPSPIERTLPAATLVEYIRDIYERLKTHSLQNVGYFKNEQVRLLLARLDIEGVDLSLFNCPEYDQLIYHQASGRRMTCRRHHHIVQPYLGNCAEEIAFNLAEWIDQKIEL